MEGRRAEGIGQGLRGWVDYLMARKTFSAPSNSPFDLHKFCRLYGTSLTDRMTEKKLILSHQIKRRIIHLNYLMHMHVMELN
jgi:hypothetical protein